MSLCGLYIYIYMEMLGAYDYINKFSVSHKRGKNLRISGIEGTAEDKAGQKKTPTLD